MIYKHSPLAYSIVNEIHQHSDAAKHSRVQTVWRYILKLGYIMQSRDLVKNVKKNRERCRYLRKRAINIEVGPVSSRSLRIEPVFYATQVDLWGYSLHNKRTTIKIWLAVYCCMSTSTTLKSRKTIVQQHSYCHLFDFLVRLAIQSFYQ